MTLFSSKPHANGQCRCGTITYRVNGKPKFTFACHCTDCQTLTAGAFSLGMMLDETQFVLRSGTPNEWTKSGDSGKPAITGRCGVCGTWLYTKPQAHPGTLVLRPSSLEDHRAFRPMAQIYTRSALPWALLAVPFSFETQITDPEPIAKAFALADGI